MGRKSTSGRRAQGSGKKPLQAVSVAFTWAARPEGRPTARLRRLALAALGRLGVTEGEVGVLVCDDATIRALNRDFRHRNAATDVLSFGGGESEPGEPPYLGDVAISLDTALRQAGASGEPLLREVETLLLHALVHLMGYDHENDQGEMDALERRLRGELLT